MTQANHITVQHGNLCVDVPRSIFTGNDCRVDPEKAAPFRTMVRNRYPWISENSMDVLLVKAQKEMMRVRDQETNGRSHSRHLESIGKVEEAIAHLQLHLENEPDDADSWYRLGELLCKAGRPEEGYKAFARGRKNFRNRTGR